MARYASTGSKAGFGINDLKNKAASSSATSTVAVKNGSHDAEGIGIRTPSSQGGARWMFLEGFITWAGAGTQEITFDLLYSFDGVNFVGKKTAVAKLVGDGTTLTQQHIAADTAWIEIPPFDFKLVARVTGDQNLTNVSTHMVNAYTVMEVWK